MMSERDLPLLGLTVLIVEDSWHLADALKQTVLQAGGTVVGPVGKLAQAEQLAARGGFTAAVMDLDLHGSAADGLAEKLAAEGKKVVVLTGYERPATMSDRIHDCLTKPIPAEQLIAALARPMARPG